MYTHYITRKIPLNIVVSKRLFTINKETNKTLEELIEFCTELRHIQEIRDFIGLENKEQAQERFTHPLLLQGKLKFIYPENPTSHHQRYLKSDIEYTEEMQTKVKELEKIDRHIEMEQMALEFCKKPRRLEEIKDHVGLAGYDIVKRR